MQNLSEANITGAVIRTFDGIPNARLQEIMTSLVKHLHALNIIFAPFVLRSIPFPVTDP